MMEPIARASPPLLLTARFLFPLGSESSDTATRSSWQRVARWLPLWGLLIGIAYAVIYRGGWRWFGEYQKLRLLPPLVLIVADFAWCGYRQLAAAVEIIDRKRAATGAAGLGLPSALAMVMIVLLKYALLVALPAGAMAFQSDWRQHLSVLYPGVIYRPLVLMPLWGRWAMLLALGIGRIAPTGSEPLRQMASGARLTAVIAWWCLLALLTVAYTSPEAIHLAFGVVIALSVLVVVYLAGFTLARQYDGQTETTVLAAGLIGELAFLVIYLPVARAIYWY